ncbi:hypothetical protein AB3538_07170 [Acinetobacter baumannii]
MWPLKPALRVYCHGLLGLCRFNSGIIYCELGAALPRAGGIIRYPVFSHGPLQGYLLGSVTVIAFSSLIAIEVVAAREYAAAWFPSLTTVHDGVRTPTTIGWLFQFALLCVFLH